MFRDRKSPIQYGAPQTLIMNAEQFRALIQIGINDSLLEECLHSDPVPYAFEPRPVAWREFREEIATTLAISVSDIRVVGSARFGFSMKPSRNLATFTPDSDIDVVIVNSDFFDELWLALLRAAYPRWPNTERLAGWLNDRQKELYAGYLTPRGIRVAADIFGEKARPVLQLRTQWFNALKRAGRYPPRPHSDIRGRLYRTWQHAELYHADSLTALQRSLPTRQAR